jgi:hypothetical protein
MAISE